MKRALILTGSLLFSTAPLAQDDPMALKVASGFVSLAGSEDNILALVYALREGIPVQLVYPADPESSALPEVVSIEPPTERMNWNDVKMALMLARDALQRYGISRPTGVQLHAVLVGGELPTPSGKAVPFRGVLQMRAEGMHWGGIAAERYRRNDVTNRIRSLA
jgi:hypothetical protein